MRLYKNDFPFFKHHPDIAFLDSAAGSLKPEAVIESVSDFYRTVSATPYRGMYKLGETATELFEGVRAKSAAWINAREANEIAFTKGATEAINAVAMSWAARNLQPGDEIILSELDHHANILPWIALANEKGLVVKWLTVNFDGSLEVPPLDEFINQHTKFIALTAHSNVLGDIDSLIFESQERFPEGFLVALARRARSVGARVLYDAAQLAPHSKIDVQKLGCDFMVFSSHKMCGPQGVGLLYVKKDLHEYMHPYQFGGGMVSVVDHLGAAYRSFPTVLEAGTQNIANIVGFGAALEWLAQVDFAELQKTESALITQLAEGLVKIDNVSLLRPEWAPLEHEHLLSFVVEGMHPHDVAAYFDQYDIAIRAGNHCAQLLHKKLGLNASVRASVYLYNSPDDIHRLLKALGDI